MKMSVLIDTTVKDFMTKYPKHIAVTMFRSAWQAFMFQPDAKSQEALDSAIKLLMTSANGTVMLVADESDEAYHGLTSTDNDDDDSKEGEDPYKGVTFH